MTNQNDIFKRLAEFEVNPPSELWMYISQSIEPGAFQNQDDSDRGIYSAVQDLIIAPPADIFQTLVKKNEDPYGFHNLLNYEETVPKNVTNSLFEVLAKENSSKQGGSKSIIRRLGEYRITAAAAAVLLIVGGWLLFKSANNEVLKTDKNPPVVKKTVPIEPTIKDTTLDLVINNKKNSGNRIKGINQIGEPTLPPFSVATVMIGEYSYKFNFTDNDVLASFANFTYKDAPPFMTDDKEAKAFTIQLDQFTAITVSQPMSAMMKKMNSFRKSGKPTNKAKRERRRLDSWKKADEKRFDSKMNYNPLDPIDLAEFIFH